MADGKPAWRDLPAAGGEVRKQGVYVPRTLHCYAAGKDGEWEAICLDLDIAVQGSSFEEVSASLREAISLYLESLSALPAEERERLLNRTAPLTLRLQFLWHAFLSLFRRKSGESYYHQYTMPLAI